MGPLDAFWHLANLFMPALGLGVMASLLAKLVWRRDLAAVAYRKLAVPACVACASVTLGGLVLLGRDGKMATYAAMVAACALTLWWRGLGPGRR